MLSVCYPGISLRIINAEGKSNCRRSCRYGRDEEEFGVVNGLVLPAGSAAFTPSGPQARQHKLRAQFGRKRTHNEQIIVAPCRIILA
jgi:hypothetical protein